MADRDGKNTTLLAQEEKRKKLKERRQTQTEWRKSREEEVRKSRKEEQERGICEEEERERGEGAQSQAVSKYEQQRQNNDIGVFKMETIPRGVALIINNQHFEHTPNRDGTQEDCARLKALFKKTLKFNVKVENDLRGEEMKTKLVDFAAHANSQKSRIDCIMVAILTHGLSGDVLLGVDGRVLEDKSSEPGTFITKEDLMEIFSFTNCPDMEGKPKLFIIQACRGVREDSCTGQEPAVPRDIVQEDPQRPPSRRQHGRADQIFLHASVADHVAYRGHFIKILADVFEKHAKEYHITELQTMITNEMKETKLAGHIFTIPDTQSHLSKLWYLNPPIATD